MPFGCHRYACLPSIPKNDLTILCRNPLWAFLTKRIAMNSHNRIGINSVNTAIASQKLFLTAASIVFTLLLIACPTIASAYEFSFSAYGPNRVVTGHNLYVEEVSAVTDITGITDGSGRAYILYFVDGLPAGATASWPLIQASCCGTNRGWGPANTLLQINVPSTVPVGTYNLTLRVQSGGVTHQIPYTMAVDAVPGPLPKQVISSIPPIPALSTWQTNMTSIGKTLCNSASIISQGTWNGNIWFYDGIRVYYQIADYTGDSSWNACAGYVESVYKPYVLNTPGVPGYYVFPHGLYQAYLRNNNDTDAKTAAIDLATQSAFSGKGGGVNDTTDDTPLRETAFLVSAYRIAGYLGSPNPTLYARAVDYLLGAFDQEFVSQTNSFHKPFMTGLAMEALIQYYMDSNDPRVPPAIKAAVDWLWANATMPDPLDPTGKSTTFYYENTDSPLSPSPDLNLLIAPAYAWLYKITGNPIYQQEGDALFQDGVTYACASCDGKHFSQNYRWSFDYVNWRSHPDITPPSPPMSLRVIQ